jgi:hypothetical protein
LPIAIMGGYWINKGVIAIQYCSSPGNSWPLNIDIMIRETGFYLICKIRPAYLHPNIILR